MSNAKFDSEGFQLVKSKYKRNYKNKQTKIPIRDIKSKLQDIEFDLSKVKRRIAVAVDDLKSSEYLENISKLTSDHIKCRKVIEIICFGLGHISECNISQYQLALLLCLKDVLHTEKVVVHDPIFYKGECKLLEELGLQVLKENTEGSYVISDQDVTLVYFPHCPKQLTNNFLWSNWNINLKNCLLICNSFKSLIENQPDRIVAETVPYIYKIQPFVNEILLENSFKYTDIFNDTSVHTFSVDKLECDQSFWLKSENIEYKEAEEFITKLMVEKLNF